MFCLSLQTPRFAARRVPKFGRSKTKKINTHLPSAHVPQVLLSRTILLQGSSPKGNALSSSSVLQNHSTSWSILLPTIQPPTFSPSFTLHGSISFQSSYNPLLFTTSLVSSPPPPNIFLLQLQPLFRPFLTHRHQLPMRPNLRYSTTFYNTPSASPSHHSPQKNPHKPQPVPAMWRKRQNFASIGPITLS